MRGLEPRHTLKAASENRRVSAAPANRRGEFGQLRGLEKLPALFGREYFCGGRLLFSLGSVFQGLPDLIHI